ncbi:MAG: M23 family metallopeptidase [Pseudomonadota bacterium]
MRFAAIALATLAAGPAASQPVLSLPIECELGETCHIQQYVDRNPGAGARDFLCQGLSYDGHKGTDFALPTLDKMHQGVNVLAAAPGVVTGVRDQMPDQYFDQETAAQVEGRECGNGLVLRHPDGWETQYCHMKLGSLQVRTGDRVKRGQVLGQVGLSGKTQFPHLHLSVRRNGDVVDPFDLSDRASCGAQGAHIWQDKPDYVPGGLLAVGFSPNLPEYDAIKAGTAAHPELEPDAPGLVVFGLMFGGRTGDTVEIDISGPQGFERRHEDQIDRNRAQYFRAFGSRLRQERWPAGLYSGTVTIRRDGEVLDTMTATTRIP